MTGMAARANRRLQDAAVQWQERQDRRNQRQQHADLRRQRMTCSPHLTSSYQTQDWTNREAMSPSGRFRVVEEKAPKTRFISREGIRWNTGWGLLISAAAVMALVLLVELSLIGNSNRTIDRLSDRIELIAGKNEEISAQLAYHSGDVNVCTEAVKLDMIAANAAKTIRLTAPETGLVMANEYQEGITLYAGAETSAAGD